jgi:hypothetical protein
VAPALCDNQRCQSILCGITLLAVGSFFLLLPDHPPGDLEISSDWPEAASSLIVMHIYFLM